MVHGSPPHDTHTVADIIRFGKTKFDRQVRDCLHLADNLLLDVERRQDSLTVGCRIMLRLVLSFNPYGHEGPYQKKEILTALYSSS